MDTQIFGYIFVRHTLYPPLVQTMFIYAKGILHPLTIWIATLQFCEAGRLWKTQHRTYNTSVGSRSFLRKQIRGVRRLIILVFRLPDKFLLLENLSLKASLCVASVLCPDKKKKCVSEYQIVTQRTVTTVPNNTNHQLREKMKNVIFILWPWIRVLIQYALRNCFICRHWWKICNYRGTSWFV